MADSYKITQADHYPLGISYIDGKVRVSAVFGASKDRGIIFFKKRSGSDSPVRISFSDELRQGNIFSCLISFDRDVSSDDLTYRLFEDDREFIDSCACGVSEHIIWMQDRSRLSLHGIIRNGRYDICREPHIQYEDSFIYMLSVRSYTEHISSGVKARGTFEGLIEKKDYIKSLGVTSLILMPCYEFYERMDDGTRKNDSMDYAVKHYKDKPEDGTAVKCNLWGYTGNAFYYMPKSSFSKTGDACSSFADLVDSFHKDNIEIIMQFYFEPDMSSRAITGILEFWSSVYHVDGFQLVGAEIPVREIKDDPMLADRKLLFDRYMISGDEPKDSYTACMDDDFEDDIRRFLKGDAYSVSNMISQIRNVENPCRCIHYIARQEGMRLIDIVTYNEKHNEHNGENNCDGRRDDFSWNCGIEGTTRRTSVNSLRLRQIKNGISMVFLTQGIPLIYGGDEFGNTQYGNNNPYCQDNEEGYVKWNRSKQSRDILEWTHTIAALREKYRILRMNEPFKGTDYLSCAYPDISLHGIDAWRTATTPNDHLIAVMYCMRYACENDSGLIYAVYNMHWEPQKVSFPKPFPEQQWKLYACSAGKTDQIIDSKGKNAIIPSRSTAVFISG